MKKSQFRVGNRISRNQLLISRNSYVTISASPPVFMRQNDNTMFWINRYEHNHEALHKTKCQ